MNKMIPQEISRHLKKNVNEIDLIFSSLNIIYLTEFNGYRFLFQIYVNKIGISDCLILNYISIL